MDTLGRAPEQTGFRPLRAAKAAFWAGAIWFLVGTAGVVYLMADADSNGLFSGSAQGRVYILVTIWANVLLTAVLTWLLAAFLWWRGTAAK
jgi:hypothetical protein